MKNLSFDLNTLESDKQTKEKIKICISISIEYIWYNTKEEIIQPQWIYWQ